MPCFRGQWLLGRRQGCHTVHVEGWKNQGVSTGDSTYGPLCYDTVLPTVFASTSPAVNGAGWYKQGVTVTLNASGPGGAGASGIKATYYQFAQSGLLVFAYHQPAVQQHSFGLRRSDQLKTRMATCWRLGVLPAVLSNTFHEGQPCSCLAGIPCSFPVCRPGKAGIQQDK
jgi:hypothetical protein